MELQDLFLTPLYLGLFYAIAYAVRPRFTNSYTKKYFIPALTVKFIGAIGLGLIYQFYYTGGDTFNYFSQSKPVYQALIDEPSVGLSLLLNSSSKYTADIIKYASQIYWFSSPNEFFVIKITGFFGLFCFNTYTVIALCFAIVSFSGMWALYTAFVRISPAAYKQLAVAVFFLPSVFFWGSGLMKDSLCIGALGWVFYGFYYGIILRHHVVRSLLLGAIGIYFLSHLKIYILLSFLPPALFWIFNEYNQKIRSSLARNLARPLFILFGLGAAYLGATRLTAGDEKYDVNKIGERTKINAAYLTTQVSNGSAYNIGVLDGSVSSLIKVAPQAVIVSIFRPFLFEARNPVMLLSALEATFFLYLTVTLLLRTGIVKSFQLIASQPILTFCFIFSIVLAIGVGTNSGNFGTLVRYKIPLMPFYLGALFIMRQLQLTQKSKSSRKSLAVRSTRRLAYS